MLISRAVLIVPISRSWILSQALNVIYLCCAILFLALGAPWMGTLMAQRLAGNLPLTSGMSVFFWALYYFLVYRKQLKTQPAG